ncbi:hypothetical protein E2C01_008446 [Portunus trituberculatus]|uniref:Uncharacterized protein n=1 Tax=Portunus trituberculatus TaxID=210409 RepID=A0A5B7D0V0_PORTR|nr:hypothetical protein [Portunus trituberculatus]
MPEITWTVALRSRYSLALRYDVQYQERLIKSMGSSKPENNNNNWSTGQCKGNDTPWRPQTSTTPGNLLS